MLLAEKPRFIKMPEDTSVHDYAEYETAARAEGIPKPTLHWVKDGKHLQLEDLNLKVGFDSASDTQVSSDLAITHFSKEYQGDVRLFLDSKKNGVYLLSFFPLFVTNFL